MRKLMLIGILILSLGIVGCSDGEKDKDVDGSKAEKSSSESLDEHYKELYKSTIKTKIYSENFIDSLEKANSTVEKLTLSEETRSIEGAKQCKEEMEKYIFELNTMYVPEVFSTLHDRYKYSLENLRDAADTLEGMIEDSNYTNSSGLYETNMELGLKDLKSSEEIFAKLSKKIEQYEKYSDN